MDRREFMRTGLAATAAFFSFGPGLYRAVASHSAPVPGPGPYGSLGAADANGIRLASGFQAREVARAGQLMPGIGYVWHVDPDGGATFATDDGGWIYVSNSEEGSNGGGVGALRFDASGDVVSAYPICVGTSRNCAGGPTPWGTWLTCEESDLGLVYECDPTGTLPQQVRLGFGSFKHEAAVVDPVTNQVYLTEDETDGRFYRFTPDGTGLPLLESGVLEVARVEDDDSVTWLRVPFPNPIPGLTDRTRYQVLGSTPFRRGEGAWFDVDPRTGRRTVFFVTTSDNTIWTHDVETQTIERLYHGAITPGNPLRGADNITMAPASGDLYVCEDGDDREMIVITPEGSVSPLLRLTGEQHRGSELAGVAFDPSGTRMYFSSQRGYGSGVTYEVTGPFRGVA